MTASINKKTGLRETPHPFYKVPHVQQVGINRIRLDGQPTAVHTVPLHDGLTLDFYASSRPGNELLVAFHGANMLEKNFYPRFERVSSLRKRGLPLLAFADPTIMCDQEREMLLSWFLGGPGWDPAGAMLKVIRKAQGKTGAKHVAFIGGSGGGFAALRMASMIPGSLAFVQDPQTNIGNYMPGIVKKYFETLWPGWDGGQLIEAFPERFDMVRHYSERVPDTFVYYAQNAGDSAHVEKHYTPFKLAHGIKDQLGVNRMGNRVFALYEGKLSGHGKITAPEFDVHFHAAVSGWREYRHKRGLD